MGTSHQTTTSAASYFSDDTPFLPLYTLLDKELVSPFLCTSDEESSDDEDKDPPFFPSSTLERSQSRSRMTKKPIPKSRELVVGDPAPKTGVSYHGSRGKDKEYFKVE